jgi:hypothetical protein
MIHCPLCGEYFDESGFALCKCQKAPPPPASGSTDWARGYYCAVATLLKEDGLTTQVRSLFAQGCSWHVADPDDIELFRRHGLIPSNNVLNNPRSH